MAPMNIPAAVGSKTSDSSFNDKVSSVKKDWKGLDKPISARDRRMLEREKEETARERE